MLRIGVQLPVWCDDAGEYLADARALDAAGVDSLWLDDDGDSAWLMLAAISAVTGQARLVAPVAPMAMSGLAARVAVLDRLSRGRLVLGVTSPSLLGPARATGSCPLILHCPDAAVDVGARSADGVLDVHDSPAACARAFTRVQQLRQREQQDGAFEYWARVDVPGDRAAWRRTLADYGAVGATGVIVRAEPRLLDMLRNADEDDDRSDLILAQG